MSDTEREKTEETAGGAKVKPPGKKVNVAAAPSSDNDVAEPLVYGAVNRVAVRLPPFWPDDPEIWFAQVEAQFEVTRTKTDSTKFYTVVQQLDQNAAREVRDIITNPPEKDRYEKLKYELVRRLSMSRDERLRKLLVKEELGDLKPSQFLRKLQSLAGPGVSDEFLRSLWSSRLPINVQQIIASQNVSLSDLADLADKITEISPPNNMLQVASTSSATVPLSFEGMLSKMEEMITSRIKSEITQQISQLNIRERRSRSRTPQTRGNRLARSRSRGRQHSQSRTPETDACWTA
ncbi:uncharacterized protein LOC134748136 [Cydia strobilella]|uniref:uncharacterized protein LOC134748136 n=1 Tax=Cydia strobilella TaxID=1100964 RepID=UPI0030045AF9